MGRTVTLAEMQAARERVAQRLAPLVEELDPMVLLSAVVQVSGAMLARHWAQGVGAVPLGVQLDAAHGLLRHAFDDELMRLRREFPATRGQA